MILICFAVFTGAVSSHEEVPLPPGLDMFTTEVFSRYNENAETFQTGVVVRLNDDKIVFGNKSDQLRLSCTEGYMRPVVLNVIRSVYENNTYGTQVVIKNLTLFYKDCRVLDESKTFPSGLKLTPCFLTIDVSSLICWTNIISKKLGSKNNCENTIEMAVRDDITGMGTVKLFFLRSSTLYTFSLHLEEFWAKKIQQTISVTSRLILSDYNECMSLSEVTVHTPKGPHVTGAPTGFPEIDETEGNDDEETAQWEVMKTATAPIAIKTEAHSPCTAMTKHSESITTSSPKRKTANTASASSPKRTTAKKASASSPKRTTANKASASSPKRTTANTASTTPPATTTANMPYAIPPTGIGLIPATSLLSPERSGTNEKLWQVTSQRTDKPVFTTRAVLRKNKKNGSNLRWSKKRSNPKTRDDSDKYIKI